MLAKFEAISNGQSLAMDAPVAVEIDHAALEKHRKDVKFETGESPEEATLVRDLASKTVKTVLSMKRGLELVTDDPSRWHRENPAKFEEIVSKAERIHSGGGIDVWLRSTSP